MPITLFRLVFAGALSVCVVPMRAAAADAPTIGQIFGSTPTVAKPYDEAFRQGLRELGYIDGKNIKVVSRYANGDASLFPALVDELIKLKVDVILATPTAVREAARLTQTIPIVCPSRAEPVTEGLVASLSRPGGNVTGLSQQGWEADPKRLQLAMEIVPNLRRFGLLFDARDSSEVAAAEHLERLGRERGVTVRALPLLGSEDINPTLRSIEKERLQVLLVRSQPLLLLHRDSILKYAGERLPVLSEGRDMAETGAVLTYSPDFFQMWRRSAVYVDKILKGAKPNELPIEQPTKFDLIINLKAAKRLGLTIPADVLVQATDVIR
jgi:putative ABC transport system substrate-binding protein